jgi:hypothetical protein
VRRSCGLCCIDLRSSRRSDAKARGQLGAPDPTKKPVKTSYCATCQSPGLQGPSLRETVTMSMSDKATSFPLRILITPPWL